MVVPTFMSPPIQMNCCNFGGWSAPSSNVQYCAWPNTSKTKVISTSLSWILHVLLISNCWHRKCLFLMSYVCCSHIFLSQINDISSEMMQTDWGNIRPHVPSRDLHTRSCFSVCVLSQVTGDLQRTPPVMEPDKWHVTREDGWLDMTLRPWHNKFKNKASATPLVATYFCAYTCCVLFGIIAQ